MFSGFVHLLSRDGFFAKQDVKKILLPFNFGDYYPKLNTEKQLSFNVSGERIYLFKVG